MRSFDELERLWGEPTPPRSRAVRLICVRKGDGRYECPARIEISAERGVAGDRWLDNPARDPRSQVTLMSLRVAELVAGTWAALHSAGDNLLVDFEVAESVLPAGTRLAIGTALLEVSDKPHLGCKKFEARFGPGALAWVNDEATRALRRRGVNCRVIQDGLIALGDVVEIGGESQT
jgi:MOSC domain-containing protein YiiM